MSINTSNRVSLIERRQKALALRNTGATLEAIAKIISQEFDLPNYNRSRCFEDVQKALAEKSVEYTNNIDALRTQALSRLDNYLLRLAPTIAQGNVKAIVSATRIIELQCRILGLEAPVQVQVEAIVSGEINGLLNGLESLLPFNQYQDLLNAIAVLGERSQMKNAYVISGAPSEDPDTLQDD